MDSSTFVWMICIILFGLFFYAVSMVKNKNQADDNHS